MNNEIISAQTLLKDTGVKLIDAARLIRNTLDTLPKEANISPLHYCSKIIEIGKHNFRLNDVKLKDGFPAYLKIKSSLRANSFQDIKYLGSRLIDSNPDFAALSFSEINTRDCELCLSKTFTTPPQFNKARTMLHGLFEFAVRREWCARNPVKLVERRKVTEREIMPLTLIQIKRLLKAAECNNKKYLPALALLIFAGIRPMEMQRLVWSDIDLDENFITIRSVCSKTGGVRQVEILPALKRILLNTCPSRSSAKICPKNWSRKWKEIRDCAGFKGSWVNDILRHTYASYHAKRFANLHRLQLNMGHRDLSLLHSRYVNMRGINKSDAQKFFELGTSTKHFNGLA